MSVQSFKAKIVSARMLAPNVRELVLDRGESAGQHLELPDALYGMESSTSG